MSEPCRSNSSCAAGPPTAHARTHPLADASPPVRTGLPSDPAARRSRPPTRRPLRCGPRPPLDPLASTQPSRITRWSLNVRDRHAARSRTTTGVLTHITELLAATDPYAKRPATAAVATKRLPPRLCSAPSPPLPGDRHDDRTGKRTDDSTRPQDHTISGDQAHDKPTDEGTHQACRKCESPVNTPCRPAHDELRGGPDEHAEQDDAEDEHSVIAPAAKPTGSRTMRAGIRKLRASTCEPTASTTVNAKPKRTSFVVTAFLPPEYWYVANSPSGRHVTTCGR